MNKGRQKSSGILYFFLSAIFVGALTLISVHDHALSRPGLSESCEVCIHSQPLTAMELNPPSVNILIFFTSILVPLVPEPDWVPLPQSRARAPPTT